MAYKDGFWWGWKVGSVVKNTYSLRGIELNSQYPHGSLQMVCKSSPRGFNTWYWLAGGMCMVCIHADKNMRTKHLYTYDTIFFKIGGFRSLGGCSWRLSQDLGPFLSESVPLVCACVLRSQIFEFGKNYHHIHQVASVSVKWIFCCCDKTPGPKQLREGILCLQFQRDEWQESIKQVAGTVAGTSFTPSTIWRD